MNKQAIISLSVVALLVLGGVAWFVASEDNTAPVSETTDPATSEPVSMGMPANDGEVSEMEVIETSDGDSQGVYTNYSAEKLASSEAETNVLFFHAAWCSVCRAIEGNMMEDGIPADLAIFQTDFDTETELRQKYGVTQQTTFVQVDTDGNLINKWVMYDTGASVDDILANVS